MIFIKMDSVDGAVQASGHEKWIEVESFQWGVSRQIATHTGGGRDREQTRPDVSEVVFTKVVDKASTALFQLAVGGGAKKTQVHFVKTSGDKLETYLEFTLENALVSSYQLSGHSRGDTNQESVSLNFTKVEIKYTPWKDDHTADSPLTAAYDVSLGKKP